MKDKHKFPTYVWMKGSNGKLSCALERVIYGESVMGSAFQGPSLKGLDKAIYHRAGGAWDVDAKYINNVLTTFGHSVKHLNGIELVECTRAEWKKDNGQCA